MLDQLVLHRTVGAQLALGGIAAVEAHEGIRELVVVLALDVLVVNVGGHGVVNVQQGYSVGADAQADVLAQGAVDIHLAAHGDAPAHQAAVHIAGLKAKLAGEGRPALVRKGHILPCTLVLLRPVQQGQLKLRHAAVEILVIGALAHFLDHLRAYVINAGIVFMLLEGHQQIQLGVFLNFHAQLIQALDGSIAGEEVLGPRSEGDDFEVLHANHRAGNRHKVRDHLGDIVAGAHGILGDVGVNVAHAQVVGAVQHAAVSIAAAVDHVAVALGCRHKHAGAVEVLGNQGFGGFGAEVAQEHHQRIALRLADVFHRLKHVGFILHGDGALVDLVLAIGSHDGSTALFGKGDGEAVAAHRNNAQLNLRDVLNHGFHAPFCFQRSFCTSIFTPRRPTTAP